MHPRARRESDADHTGDLFWHAILEPLADVAQSVLDVSGHLWGQYRGLRDEPGAVADYARVAAAVAKEIGKLALLANDSQTRFKGKPGTVKRVAWSEPDPHWPRSRPAASTSAARSTTPSSPAWPAPCAATWSPRATP
jgi:diacylglycerol O-acyltransferase